MSTEPEEQFIAWQIDPEYPDPLPTDLERPEFEAVWQAIKGWDLSRDSTGGRRLYSGATGNDVMHILNGLSKAAAEPEPDADGCLEALHDTQTHIENCLAAGEKLEAVRDALDDLIKSIELDYGNGEGESLDGAIDADLIYEDIKDVRALCDGSNTRAEERCSECDPSFGCFSNPSQCSKRAPTR